jgi:hypothetical protein
VKFKLAARKLRASLSRRGTVYATGYAELNRGRVTLLSARPLPRGRYLLTVTRGPRLERRSEVRIS